MLMKVRLDKPWTPLTPQHVARVPGELGVYQLATADGRVIYIGYAGGKSRYGLRGEIERHLNGPATQFRYESNSQYLSRWRELLMLHLADEGELPELNRNNPPVRLGRIG
ncbi:MAG: hypothetical protein Kow0010_20760 [Dehalococcoidia bacterium]